jgi:hypothetical protein
VAFRRPWGGHPPSHPSGRSRAEALHALSRPFRDVSSQPRTAWSVPHTGPKTGARADSRAMLPLLSFRSLRHLPDRQTRLVGGAGSLRRRVPRPGFGYPLRGLHHRSSRCRSTGASLGFALQGVPLVASRTPFGAPALLTLPLPCAPSPCGEDTEDAAASRASFPRRVRAVVQPPRGRPDRRYLLGLSPSRAFPPSVRAIASSHDASPLALGQGDVPTHLDLRASRIEWIGLVRFRTAGSPGVPHLPTVTALRPPFRGAGSWFRLAQEIA